MAMAQPPRTHDDYRIGIICALASEAAAMEAMLDEIHPMLRKRKDKDDENHYRLGRIGIHSVVIACLPAGMTGNGPAAAVAKGMRHSFPITFGLMVGVGGGVWSKKNDVRLGDVVVSHPTGIHGGVVQWDFGKRGVDGKFQRTGSLNKPPLVLLHALQRLKMRHILDGVTISEPVSLLRDKLPHLSELYRHPGKEQDQLFHATSSHFGQETCEECDLNFLLERPSRMDSKPRVHYGNIASGNEVMKDGVARDSIAREEDVLCFEMEAAGLMDNFPCIVIRGICDYADSHKNKIWQPYAAATAAAFARELLGCVVEQEAIKTHHTPRPIRVLPFGRNKNFIGRQHYLDYLFQIFHENDTEEDCQRAALVGLGGVGKTQIAIEFAFQIQKLYPAISIFWVRASDTASFESAYHKIGEELGIPGLSEERADVKELVKARLSQESAGKWLVILDNADDFEFLYRRADDGSGSQALHDYLPFSFNGAILFTSRDHKAATKYAGSNVLTIDEMGPEESKDLLKAGLQNKKLVEDEEGTTTLLKLLENLPLAIVQAVSYLNEEKISLAEYLKIYEDSSHSFIMLLTKDFEDRGRYPGTKNPIAITWLISFEQVRHRDPLAGDYMAFMACIKEQSIPRDLLPPASRFEQMNSIGTLKAFGFIKERLREDIYDMHRLVHIAMHNWLNLKNELEAWNEKTLEHITNVFPWPVHENKEMWTIYLPHAEHVISMIKVSGGAEKIHGQVLSNVAECYAIMGKYSEAELMIRQALQQYKNLYSLRHESTLASMDNLASTLSDQGKYSEAEKMHRQVLELQEKTVGIEHPDTLTSMSNLAITLQDQGKYSEAEKMHRQVLELREKVLGMEYPDTLASMNNLAITLSDQGKYSEAEKMHRQVLELQEKVLGAQHPNTLRSIRDYGNVLYQQGAYTEASKMYRRAFELQEKVLGAQHPDTLRSVYSYGNTLYQQGAYTEASKMYRRAFELKEKVLGAQHPDTLQSKEWLANSLVKLGEHEEAAKVRAKA